MSKQLLFGKLLENRVLDDIPNLESKSNIAMHLERKPDHLLWILMSHSFTAATAGASLSATLHHAPPRCSLC